MFKSKRLRWLVALVTVLILTLMVSYYTRFGESATARINLLFNLQPRVKTVTLSGNSGNWVDTGFELKANKTYDVTGTGNVCFYPPDNCFDGMGSVEYTGFCNHNGCSFEAYCNRFAQECQGPWQYDPHTEYSHASVVVKVGDGECGAGAECYGSEGPSDPIGSIRASNRSRVYLMINDHLANDNTGSFEMRFERQN